MFDKKITVADEVFTSLPQRKLNTTLYKYSVTCKGPASFLVIQHFCAFL